MFDGEYKRARYARWRSDPANLEKKAAQSALRFKTSVRARLALALSRAKKRHSVTITPDDLVTMYKTQKGKCALTGITMKFATGDSCDPFNMSLDRINGNKGYESENVRLVLQCINSFKLKMTDAKMLAVAKALVNHVR